MSFRHNSRVAENEPSWGSIDKTKLPRQAFAYVGDAKKKSTWGYPHHWVRGGKTLDENGVWKDGELLLHRGGLNAAWAAAMGARTGRRASPQIIAHLREHRRALEQQSSRLLDLLCQPGALTIECAEGEDAQGEKLPRFRMVAYTGEPMRLGGWYRPVVVDLAGLSIPRQSVPVRFNHDPATGVGHTTRVAIEDGKLVAEGVISRDTSEASEIVRSARRGFPWQASIGASVEEFEYVKENQKVVVNGRELNGPINVVRRAVLGEISFVDLGADRNTSAAVAAQAQTREEAEEMNAELKQWLAAQGIDEIDWTDEQLEALEKLRNQLSNHQPAQSVEAGQKQQDPERPLDAQSVLAKLREEAAAETERIATIRKLAKDHPRIEAQAIKEGWSAEKTELEVLRASRSQVRTLGASTQARPAGKVIEAALCLAARLDEPEKHFDEKTLEAADRYNPLGLQEVLLLVARANGYDGRPVIHAGNLREVLQFAFPSRIQAAGAPSYSSLSGILSNVANKFLAEGFLAVESAWRTIAGRRSVTDFKTNTIYRLTENAVYEPLAPGGQIKHGQLSEENYTLQARTYAKMLTLTREAIINDDLGALGDLRKRLGRGAALNLNSVFWSTFLNNGSFFTAARGNLVTSNSLSLDGLGKAVKAFREQTGADGHPVGVTPKYVLVPPALEVTAKELYTSVEVRELGTSAKRYMVTNVFAKAFEPVVSAYIGAAIGNGSDTTWYLVADPADLPVAEIGFLEGKETPTVEATDADFDTLGIVFRGYHDFGCALAEYRAGVKCTA